MMSDDGGHHGADLPTLDGPTGSPAMFATDTTDTTDTTKTARDHATTTDTLHTLAALWRNESTADPLARLTGHGWSARSREITDLAGQYERPVPPAFDPTVPGTARIALLQATRT
ncbi:hypothetical protein [Streptomyces sp. NPDC088358]|uniref:hypothetical protein n=1 Tax=Streptomyces sp. NPDC088358 TaxID=3365857 RepID=UPI003813FF0B